MVGVRFQSNDDDDDDDDDKSGGPDERIPLTRGPRGLPRYSMSKSRSDRNLRPSINFHPGALRRDASSGHGQLRPSMNFQSQEDLPTRLESFSRMSSRILRFSAGFSQSETSGVPSSRMDSVFEDDLDELDGRDDDNHDIDVSFMKETFCGPTMILPLIICVVAYFLLVVVRNGGWHEGRDETSQHDGPIIPNDGDDSGTIPSPRRRSHSLLLILLLSFFVLREVVRCIPPWVIPRGGRRNRRHHGYMSDLRSVSEKVGAVVSQIGKRMGGSIGINLWRRSLMTKFKLMQQIRRVAPHLRDALYERSGRPSHVPKEVIDNFCFADWAYYPHSVQFGWDTLEDALEQAGYHMMRHQKTAAPGCAGNYIALDYAQKVVLIVIKGTSTFSDIITDTCSFPVPYELPRESLVEGKGRVIRVHEGMMYAAQHLGEEILPMVEELFLPHGYRILILGHSLGGGVASLLGMYLRSWFPETRGTDLIQVYAYAAPPVVDKDTALDCSDFITTVVHNADFVSRLSINNVFIAFEFNKRFLKALDGKGQCPTNIISYFRWLWMFFTQKEIIVSPEDYSKWTREAMAATDPLEAEHLFVPGRIYLVYMPWDKKGADDSAYRVIECNGMSDAMAVFEYDLAHMFMDHIAYYPPLNAARESAVDAEYGTFFEDPKK